MEHRGSNFDDSSCISATTSRKLKCSRSYRAQTTRTLLSQSIRSLKQEPMTLGASLKQQSYNTRDRLASEFSNAFSANIGIQNFQRNLKSGMLLLECESFTT